MCNNSCQRAQYAPLCNKADAMQFAIITTMEPGCGTANKVNYEEAKKLYDFIVQTVTFPDDEQTTMMQQLIQALGVVRDSLKARDPFADFVKTFTSEAEKDTVDKMQYARKPENR